MQLLLHLAVGLSAQDDEAALSEIEAAAQGPGQPHPGPSLEALDPAAPAGAALAALAARRAAAAERETALGRWAIALTGAAARLASERRALRERAEQVRRSVTLTLNPYTTCMPHCGFASKTLLQHDREASARHAGGNISGKIHSAEQGTAARQQKGALVIEDIVDSSSVRQLIRPDVHVTQ